MSPVKYPPMKIWDCTKSKPLTCGEKQCAQNIKIIFGATKCKDSK